MKHYIGLDPGRNGGLVEISSEGVSVLRMPTIAGRISPYGISDWLESRLAAAGRENILIGLEDVHAMEGKGAKATFQFGRALGILEGAIAAFRIPFIAVTPKDWQAIAHLGIPKLKKTSKAGGRQVNDPKAMSLLAAERLYPHVDLRATEKCKNAHDGIVDALLIAHYLKTQNL
jgi:hypothetical protein